MRRLFLGWVRDAGRLAGFVALALAGGLPQTLGAQGGPPLPPPARPDSVRPDTLRRPPAAPPADSGPRPGALVPLAPVAKRDTAANARLLGDLGDLGLSMNATLESKLERLKNDRCTTAQRTVLGNNCNGTFLPNFNFQFDARSNGNIGNRVFLDVDYDSKREFDGANLIALRYQGRPEQRLQSVEVGNVTFETPASRFLTSGIPSGNYGVQAKGKWGGVSFSGIAAQQKGTISRDNIYTVGARTEQQVERIVEDVQIEQRRFFFTVDPRQLRGYPNIDLLNRQQMRQLAASLPDSVRPSRLYVYRQYIGQANQNPRGPQFSVRGARNPSRQIYEVLRENVDYYVDPSQLWIALIRPLSPSTERLAVAYEVNVNGVPSRNVSTGGSPDIEFTDGPQFANLLWEPELQPTNPAYFLREIKSAYRLGGSELRRETLGLRLVTGTSGDQEKPIDPSAGETYLKLFGLAEATNPALFDVENRVWPRPNDPNFRAAFSGAEQDRLIPDYFVIFPSLQPFARAGLARPIANPANDTLYSFPNEYFNTAQRPQAIYRMVLRYVASGDESTQAIQLPSTLVRPNSERVLLEGRPLQRDRDYTVNYDIGLITFNRPDTLFANPRQVSVRFEENPQFQTITPTTIIGFNSLFPLDNGQLAFTAISQQQNTVATRPTLGLEPIGSMVAGLTGTMQWDATVLTKALGKLPFRPSAVPSRVALQGEFAMSKPQPNSAGLAYLESFEGQSEVPLALADAAWYFSSRPALGTALGGLATSVFSLNRASTLAYQNFGVTQSGSQLQFNITQIDPSVRFVGSGAQPAERLLWMTLYPLATGGVFDAASGSAQRRFAWNVGPQSQVGTTPGGRRWRSLRTVLNPSGADLSRMENIEFYVLVQSEQAKLARNPTLVFDFGDISENSVTFAPETLTINTPARPGLKPDSTYRGKRLVGFDRLDSERDPFSRAFNAAENDRGLAGHRADTLVVVDRTGAAPVTTVVNNITLCTQSAGAVQALGDSRANCTAGNNLLDEEDLDLDGQLNLTAATVEQESVKRFVVDLSDRRSWTRTGRCFQQSDSTAGIASSDSLCWVQVRLNWRAPTEQLNNPNDRRMRALRMSMLSNAGAADGDFVRIALARFRLIGAPWLKRSADPLSGIAGDSSGTVGGYVIASVVGTLDSSAVLPYTPPPGVAEVPENRQTGYEAVRTQVNERALRLQAGLPGRQFRVFDRAEAFYRFPNGTQTFMGYRTLRLWMRGRGNGWGEQGELNGYVKLGRDENNFYLYRTPVNTGASQSAWLPEVRVDLSRFQVLRARLENAFLTGSADSLACTGADLELVKRSGKPRGVNVRRFAVCEDGYIVYSADPAVTPPNLAGVQEMAVGLIRMDSVSRGGSGIMANDTLELWVNDVRLTDVVDDLGFAGELGLSLNAGDFADVRLNLSRRDPNFRQLGETPTFLTTSGVNIGTTLHLERFLPAKLGLAIPFSIDYSGSGVEQLFVNRSDVRASGIDNLRNPRDRRTSYAFAVRRATPLEKGWYAPVVNALAFNGSWSNAGLQSAFQEATANSYLFGGGLALGSEVRQSRLPRLLTGLTAVLPRRWRESARVKQWREQPVRWAPTQFRLNSSVARTANTTTSFTKVASLASDTGEVVAGLTNVWANTGTLEFRPVQAFMASINARQLLDLRDYRGEGLVADSLDRGRAATDERLQLLGANVGLERERSVNSVFALQPQVSNWLRPRADFTSTFALNRDPNARVLLRSNDTTGAFRLPKRLGAAQSLNLGSVFDLARLVANVTREKSTARRLGALLAPIDVQWQQSLTSNYDNTAYIPGWGLQFGLGGLESFRGIDRQLATTAGRLRRTTVQGALNLPFALTLQARAEQGTTETWTRRTLDGFQAVITSTQLVRPDYRLSWNWRPVRLGKIVSLVSVNGRYLITEQETTIPNELGGLADRSRTVARNRPLSASITWSAFGNLVTNASVNRQRREDLRPGSITNGDTRTMSFDIQRVVRLPKTWNTRDGQLRTSASYQSEEAFWQVNGTSVFTGATLTTAPSVITNTGRRAYNLNASTDLSDLLSLNVTGSQIVNFDRNVNRQLSTLVFSAVLQVRFFSGTLR